jgi:cell division FtsZ-interacting protein ZapD
LPFAFYERLTRSQQRVYRHSDGVAQIAIPRAADLRPVVDTVQHALAAEDRLRTQAAADRLLAEIASRLGVPPLRTQVLAARPSNHWGELHGLYHGAHAGQPARVTVWMRTAARRQVVKFRTFLRTLLHELCHHLDYELLELTDSFHTEGFYQRESSLLRQLLPPVPDKMAHADA